MFGVGIFEIMIIGGVALIVLGPEKLTRTARMVGLLWVRLQRQIAEVKADIHRELELEELKRLRSEVVESAQAVEHSIHAQVQEIRDSFEPVKQDIAEAMNPTPLAAESASDAPPSPQAELPLAGEERPLPPVDDSQLDLFGQPIPPAPPKS